MPPPPPPISAGMPIPGGLMGPPAAQMAQPTIGPQAMPPGMISMLDPATNNQPLQFNTNKGKPPMPVMGEMQEAEPRVMIGGGRPERVLRERERNDRDYDRDRERSRSTDASKLTGLLSPAVLLSYYHAKLTHFVDPLVKLSLLFCYYKARMYCNCMVVCLF